MLPGGTPFELSAARGDMGNIPELLGFIRKLRARELNPRLVILDPLDNLVMNGTIQSKQGAVRLMKRLEFVARRTGVTILIFHHLVEDGKKGKVGGSSKVVDVPRWVYRIERDEDAPELMILKKYKGNRGDPQPIRYRVIKDGLDSRISWVGGEQYTAEERSWRDMRPGQDRVLDLLAKSTRPLGARDIAATVGLPENSVRVMIHKLAKAGRVYSPERGVWLPADTSNQVEYSQVRGLTVVPR
jgi:AAA domain/IclR helix-turn-helix domain